MRPAVSGKGFPDTTNLNEVLELCLEEYGGYVEICPEQFAAVLQDVSGSADVNKQKRAKWYKWEEMLWNDIAALHRSTCIYMRLYDIIVCNPALKVKPPRQDVLKGDELFRWIFSNYYWASVMVLRRQTELAIRQEELNPDTWSLANLITDMLKNSSEIPEMDVTKFKYHLIQLKDAHETLKSFADKKLAHFDKQMPTKISLKKLKKMIDITVEAYQYTHWVLRGSEVLLPEDKHPWECALRIPWLYEPLHGETK